MLAGVHQIINLTENLSWVYRGWVKMIKMKTAGLAIMGGRV